MKINVTVKPNSKHREQVVTNENGSLTVFTKAAAVDGKANDAATKLLAKHYGVNKSRVRLIRGHTSKQKLFEIDIDLDEERRKQEIADQVIIINQVIL